MTVNDVSRCLCGRRRGAKRAYVRRIFEQIAPRYDLLNHLLSLNIDRGWRRRAIAALEWTRVRAGATSICAPARWTSARAVASAGFRGVSSAPTSPSRCCAPGRQGAAASCRPVVADALDLPLRDRSAAGAIVAFGIRNVARLDARCARCIASSRREGGS